MPSIGNESYIMQELTDVTVVIQADTKLTSASTPHDEVVNEADGIVASPRMQYILDAHRAAEQIDIFKGRKQYSHNVLLNVTSFILLLEFAERLSYYAINQGLKNYLDKFGWSQVGSNALKSTWTSACYLAPLFGGYLADAKWGRYKTLVVFGVWYLCGMMLLIVSAHPDVMENTMLANWLCHIGLFSGVAIGTGAIKANVVSFGADQFDLRSSNQSRQLMQYYKYFYVIINAGAIFSYGYLSILCIQGSGVISAQNGYFYMFIICGGMMAIACALFFAANSRYVHHATQPSVFTEFWYVLKSNCEFSEKATRLYYGLCCFAASFVLNFIAAFLADSYSIGHYVSYISLVCVGYAVYSCVRYGMNVNYMDKSMASNGGKIHDDMVEEVKLVVRVFPFTCLMILWECAYDQLDANFQSITQQCDLRINAQSPMDTEAQQVPGALLGIIDPLIGLILVPLLDVVIYPLYTKVIGRTPSAYGKVLVGLLISTFAMIWTGIFEVLRRDSGILTTLDPNTGELVPILDHALLQPMNHMYWAYAVPSYVLVAVAQCLINVTAYELLYREIPPYLKTTCQAINLFMLAIGSNVTSTFTLIFKKFFPQNLNDGNIEYMYYSLGVLGIINILVYVLVMERMNFGMLSRDDMLVSGDTCTLETCPAAVIEHADFDTVTQNQSGKDYFASGEFSFNWASFCSDKAPISSFNQEK